MRDNLGDVWCEVTIDTTAIQDGWQGDTALDSSKDWSPYMLVLCRQTEDGPEMIDSLCATWASDDVEGRKYLFDTIDDQLLDNADNTLPSIDDLDVRFV